MESRRYFVDQVASTILENHGQTETGDSFIFGISGKWGEGKTRFLQDLEKEIKRQDPSFEILWVNPWKFVSDKISFLRSFLAQLPIPKLTWLESVRAFLRSPTEFRDLHYDVSKDVIDWRMLLLLSLDLCWALVLYFYGNQLPIWDEFHTQIPNQVMIFFKIIGVSLLVPALLAIFKSISTYQQGSKTISTIDRFEDLLKLKLEQNSGKKFLIYIDDLDRVTPTVARDVLDNLRTFFDKPELSFIVAGDHTVLERYIGTELLPGDNESPAQLEEGRRYLKKIFNVYWRLPPPIPTELMRFIEHDLFSPSKDDLDKIFPGAKGEAERKKLASVLARYFDGNFRQIIRFFEMVRFTFQIIEKKRAAVTAEEKPYFDELIEYPLLVIRILMIQENCTPLFEAVLRDPEILLSLEDAVENKNPGAIQDILNQQKLSPNQKNFIEKFLFEEPRFYKDSSLVVSNLQPFLVLAADSSFGDGRGPSPEKFIEIINTGNPESVRKSILSSGEPRLKEAASNFATEFNNQGVGPQQNTLMTTLITALSEVPDTHNSHDIFATQLHPLDFGFSNSLSPAERVNTYRLIWSWLDSFKDTSQYINFAGKFIPVSIDDFNQIQLEKAVGAFSSTRITEWFKAFYPSQKTPAYSRFVINLPYLNKDAVSAELTGSQPEIMGDLIHNREGVRDAALEVVLLTDQREELAKRVIERIKDLDQDFWNWVKTKVISEIKITEGDMEESVMNRLDVTPDDFSTLVGVVNFAATNNFSTTSILWEKIARININSFVNNLSHFASNALPQITPDKASARTLFSALLDKIMSLDESLQPQHLRWLRKDVWRWKNMDKLRSPRTIEKMAQGPNADIAREASEVLNGWTSGL